MPRLSKYHAFGNYTLRETGQRYLSEIWYYHEWDSFQEDRDYLFSYLREHGAVTPIILDLSDEIAGTRDPYISGLGTKQVRAYRYISDTTSGYLIIISTDFFPNQNYFIAYYGVDGRSDLSGEAPHLKALILSVFPGFVEHSTFTSDPASPQTPFAAPAAASVAAPFLLAAAIALRERRSGR